MKKPLLFALFYLTLTALTAQTESNAPWLRLYLGTEVAPIVSPEAFFQNGELIELRNRTRTEVIPVLGLGFVQEAPSGKYVEIALRYAGPVDGNRQAIVPEPASVLNTTILAGYTNRRAQLHLERGASFGLMGLGKLKSQVGIFARANYDRFELESFTSTIFPENQTRIGLQLGITPHLQWLINRRWTLEVSTPVQLIEATWMRQFKGNPALTKSQNTNTSGELGALAPYTQFRLGISWRLRKEASVQPQ